MKRPTAIPLDPREPPATPARAPRAFAADDIPDLPATVDTLTDAAPDPETVPIAPRKANWLVRLLWTTAGLLVSLGLGLAADALIRDLFATNTWLGWVGVTILALFVLAAVILLAREVGAIWRLRSLDHLKSKALAALASDRLKDAQPIVAELKDIYAPRADLSRALATLKHNETQFFDGGELLRYTERTLMAPLDARARALAAAEQLDARAPAAILDDLVLLVGLAAVLALAGLDHVDLAAAGIERAGVLAAHAEQQQLGDVAEVEADAAPVRAAVPWYGWRPGPMATSPCRPMRPALRVELHACAGGPAASVRACSRPGECWQRPLDRPSPSIRKTP